MTNEIVDFEQDVIARSRTVPVVVDFWAEWCGPCKILGPVIEKIAAESKGRWVLAKLNTETHPEIAERYGITGIPTVKLFVDGEVSAEFIGALPEREIRRWLAGVLPSPNAAQIADAATLIERGEFVPAAALLREAIAAEPTNLEARALLARALLHLEPEAIGPALAGLDDDPAFEDRAEALRVLASVALLPGRPDALPESDVKARFLEGALAVRAGEWARALEAFIDVLQRERGYDGGAAKHAGRAIFLLLGSHHPVSEQFHRAFASVVFV